MRLTIYTLFLLLAFNCAKGQVKTIKLDRPNSISTAYEVHPLSSTGLFLIHYKDQIQSQTVTKQVDYYNAELELVRSFLFEIDERYSIRSRSNEEGLFLLYQKQVLKNDLMMMHIKPSGESKTYQIPLLESMIVDHFDVHEGMVFFSGSFETRPTSFLYEMETNRIITLQGFYQKGVPIIESLIDKEENIISVLTKVEIQGSQASTYGVKNFDLNGTLLRDIVLQTDLDKSLTVGYLTNFANQRQYVIGMYTEKVNFGQTGIYVARIESNGEQQIRYTPFYELPGFYGHKKESKAQKLRLKARAKKQKKGLWTTNKFLSYYKPLLYEEGIYLEARASQNIRSLFQMKINFDGEIEKVDYTNGNLKFWQAWYYNNEFYQSSISNDKVLGVISGKDGSTNLSEDLPEFKDYKYLDIFPVLVHWYENKILVYWTEKEQITDKGNFILSSFTLKRK